jgi:hypothetical protein
MELLPRPLCTCSVYLHLEALELKLNQFVALNLVNFNEVHLRKQCRPDQNRTGESSNVCPENKESPDAAEELRCLGAAFSKYIVDSNA